MGQLAVFDPEAGGAARIISGDDVDPVADQAGYVEPARNRANDLLGGLRAWLKVEISRRNAGSAGQSARGVMRGFHAELARGIGVERVAAEDSAFDEQVAPGWQAFTIEGRRAVAARSV